MVAAIIVVVGVVAVIIVVGVVAVIVVVVSCGACSGVRVLLLRLPVSGLPLFVRLSSTRAVQTGETQGKLGLCRGRNYGRGVFLTNGLCCNTRN